MLPTAKNTNLLIFLGCAIAMSVAYYMQYQMGLEPCPLCMTQRIFVMATALIALIAFIHASLGQHYKFYSGFSLLTSVTGGGFSMRQLYLQSLPPEQAPACGPGLGYMLDNFPLMQALEIMLKGDGNCAEVMWIFMGVSIPGWTLVAFTILAAISIWQLLRKN
jgi:disulfide bond formation protein DsbB|tara:strand:- start:6299 stop:6787 length:489 start_codon:yes stop_codon:yes gene_type:complete